MFRTLVAFAALAVGGLATLEWMNVTAPTPRDVERPSFAPGAAPHTRAAFRSNLARPLGGIALIVPVAGVERAALVDTWGHSRSHGRTHEGIDILAPSGVAVLAVADGRVARFFESERGGITIYQFDRTERWVYYYAHLSARAPGLAEGDHITQGQVIGYVGETGNAPVPHLHFEIQRLGPERRWWEADSVNPFPYLIRGDAPG